MGGKVKRRGFLARVVGLIAAPFALVWRPGEVEAEWECEILPPVLCKPGTCKLDVEWVPVVFPKS